MNAASVAADALHMVEGTSPRGEAQRVALLLEHVAALDRRAARASAHERLERLVGSSLARLLVGALVGRRGRAREL